jgi:hypothetical protein
MERRNKVMKGLERVDVINISRNDIDCINVQTKRTENESHLGSSLAVGCSYLFHTYDLYRYHPCTIRNFMPETPRISSS